MALLHDSDYQKDIDFSPTCSSFFRSFRSWIASCGSEARRAIDVGSRASVVEG